MNTMTLNEAPAGGTGRVGDEALMQWMEDDDIALGCECANPALQIERWHHEVPPTSASY
jgi:hypothetical protein